MPSSHPIGFALSHRGRQALVCRHQSRRLDRPWPHRQPAHFLARKASRRERSVPPAKTTPCKPDPPIRSKNVMPGNPGSDGSYATRSARTDPSARYIVTAAASCGLTDSRSLWRPLLSTMVRLDALRSAGLAKRSRSSSTENTIVRICSRHWDHDGGAGTASEQASALKVVRHQTKQRNAGQHENSFEHHFIPRSLFGASVPTE